MKPQLWVGSKMVKQFLSYIMARTSYTTMPPLTQKYSSMLHCIYKQSLYKEESDKPITDSTLHKRQTLM